MGDNIKELEVSIGRHNKLYWGDNNPEISDEDYDALLEDLREKDPKHPLLNYVGTSFTGREKVKHEEPMLSLDKCYSEEELLVWATKVARSDTEVFQIAPKYDGISASDTITKIISRGDGEEGEDISDVREKLKSPSKPGRGELIILKSDLPKLPKTYKTCRSAAAGIVSNTENIGRFLQFMSFDSYDHEIELQDFKNIDWEETLEDYQNKDYPTDGVVISLKDKSYGDSLGNTDHHPRHSIAYKYKNPKGETKLKGIDWQVGKYKLTPVALLEPVTISGYTHTKASLHNWDQVERLGISIGDKVEIMRCGDVIPQLVKVIKKCKKPKEITLPLCPACGTQSQHKGVDVVCGNNQCKGYLSKLLQDSLDRIGFKDIGPATVNDLILNGYHTCSAVLNMHELDWRKVVGDGKKKKQYIIQCQKLCTSPMEDYKVLASLNIRGLGISIAKKILNVMTINEVRTASDLSGIEGIGTTMSDRIKNEINSVELIEMLRVINLKETKGLAEKPLICFTGKSDKPRNQWVDIAEENGYIFQKTVTKNLSLLVTGGKSSNKSKKADNYGIEVLTYEEFEERLNGPN